MPALLSMDDVETVGPASRVQPAAPGAAVQSPVRVGGSIRSRAAGPLTRRPEEDHVVEHLTATLHTNRGDIRLVLFEHQAPKTVRNFVELASGGREWTDPQTRQATTAKLYDGTTFHRVISGFMIQGGDPLGTGTGGPGYKFADEFHPELSFNRPYLLAMANAGPNSNGSQFFITVTTTPHLNYKHTIFGEVADAESRQVVDAIATTATGAQDRPVEPVVIESVTIEQPQA
jgi:peptidyl-prolyl cis-trans isomerase A (cyclophilin A)